MLKILYSYSFTEVELLGCNLNVVGITKYQKSHKEHILPSKVCVHQLRMVLNEDNILLHKER